MIDVYPLCIYYTSSSQAVSLNPLGGDRSLQGLFILGLLAGLLTFGGAYTAVPFVQRDAVILGKWITNRQFLDGLALGSILPTPLVMFTTFVGYVGHGFSGAVVMTLGMFIPGNIIFDSRSEYYN